MRGGAAAREIDRRAPRVTNRKAHVHVYYIHIYLESGSAEIFPEKPRGWTLIGRSIIIALALCACGAERVPTIRVWWCAAGRS